MKPPKAKPRGVAKDSPKAEPRPKSVALTDDDVFNFIEMLTPDMTIGAFKHLTKKLDTWESHAVTTLRRMLIFSIVRDLADVDKCTPGLYQAAMRLLDTDTVAAPAMTGEELTQTQKMLSTLPFSKEELNTP